MAERHRRNLARVGLASVIVAGGTLGLAIPAAAEPEPVPVPVPGDIAAAPPGQPVAVPVDAPAAPPPLPVGPPPVPEMSNPVYGQGQTGGSFGYLRDLWKAARSGNPGAALAAGPSPDAPGPPPGAGPAPQLPPGFTSVTAPESSTPGNGYQSGGPPLPPGYYPIEGPPPPGWFDSVESPGSPPPALDPGSAPPPAP